MVNINEAIFSFAIAVNDHFSGCSNADSVHVKIIPSIFPDREGLDKAIIDLSLSQGGTIKSVEVHLIRCLWESNKYVGYCARIPDMKPSSYDSPRLAGIAAATFLMESQMQELI